MKHVNNGILIKLTIKGATFLLLFTFLFIMWMNTEDIVVSKETRNRKTIIV